MQLPDQPLPLLQHQQSCRCWFTAPPSLMGGDVWMTICNPPFSARRSIPTGRPRNAAHPGEFAVADALAAPWSIPASPAGHPQDPAGRLSALQAKRASAAGYKSIIRPRSSRSERRCHFLHARCGGPARPPAPGNEKPAAKTAAIPMAPG